MLSDDMTLAEVREYLMNLRETTGAVCPCCGRVVKSYPRKVNRNCAKFLLSLIRVWREQGSVGWVHYKRCVYTSRDYNYMQHFGLVTTPVEEGQEGRGFWQPTQEGIAFAEGRIRVPEGAQIYNNEILWYSRNTVDIMEALGSPFDYEELMGAPLPRATTFVQQLQLFQDSDEW